MWKEQARRQLRTKTQAQVRELERNLEKLQKQQKALQQEVLKSFTGENSYEPAMLQTLLADVRTQMEDAENALIQCQHEKYNEEAKLEYLAML